MGPRRAWWTGLLLFFSIAAAWAFITPYNGAYDEHDHVVRAAGVVRGQFLVTPARGVNDGGYPVVPRSLVPPNVTCMAVAANPPPGSCLGTPPDDRTAVPVHSRAARYNPVYYAVVGWPLLVFPDMTGVILARLISALLCAALLATAVSLVLPLRRQRFLLLAVLLAASPMLLSLNGLVNPSGIAIDAAILLWVVLLRARAGGDAMLHRLGALAGVTLVVTRPEGFVLVAGIAVLAWLALDVPRPKKLHWSTAAIGVATLGALLWVWVSRVGEFGAQATPITKPLSSVVRTVVEYNVDYWMRQTVGLFGYGTIGLPLWLYLAWGAVAGGLLVWGFALADRARLAAMIVAIPLLCLAAGVVADIVMARIVGYWMQGRYFLPLWVGAFLLAAWALPDVADRRTLRRFYTAGIAVWAVANSASLAIALLAFVAGKQPRSGAFAVAWLPPGGVLLPAALLLAGIAGAVLMSRWQLREQPEAADATV